MEIKLDNLEKKELIELISKKFTKKEVMWALKESVIKNTDEKIFNKYIEKASEKAIKDIANWKIVRENVYYGIQIEKLQNQLDEVLKQLPKYVSELKKVTKYFEEVIKV